MAEAGQIGHFSSPALRDNERMFSLQQAFSASPTLARMAERVRLSQAMLETLQPHLPSSLRSGVQAGPIDDDGSWCILVANPSAATKLRLLQPALLSALRVAGHAVPQLRIKVRKA